MVPFPWDVNGIFVGKGRFAVAQAASIYHELMAERQTLIAELKEQCVDHPKFKEYIAVFEDLRRKGLRPDEEFGDETVQLTIILEKLKTPISFQRYDHTTGLRHEVEIQGLGREDLAIGLEEERMEADDQITGVLRDKVSRVLDEVATALRSGEIKS